MHAIQIVFSFEPHHELRIGFLPKIQARRNIIGRFYIQQATQIVEGVQFPEISQISQTEVQAGGLRRNAHRGIVVAHRRM